MWEVAVRLAVACGVCGGVFLCCPFSRGVSWMGSWAWLGLFLGVFLPTLKPPKRTKKNIRAPKT